MNKTYAEKKAYFDRMLTVYGRNAVLECLRDERLGCHALHIADSNRPAAILSDIERLAKRRGITVQTHSRKRLAHLSRNGKQDQGVALDVLCPGFKPLTELLEEESPIRGRRLLALDRITNPQNLGMIIRSSAAGHLDGLILAERGNASLGPLVIKASAGTIFRAPILFCDGLPTALDACRARGASVVALEAGADQSLFDYSTQDFIVYVLGNETNGLSSDVRSRADGVVSIPLNNEVESLNVAVMAGLIAFAPYFDR
ncbi:MAG: RNA methyltransferase [Pseudomonadota bacterium]